MSDDKDKAVIVTEGAETQGAAELQAAEQEHGNAGESHVAPLTAQEAIDWLREDGDADPEGTARLNHPELFDNGEQAPAPPAYLRTTPLAWHELAPFSIAGTIELAAWVQESAEQALIMKTEPHYHTEWVSWGVMSLLDGGQESEVLRYVIDRRPAPEVLFNKMRELGHVTGAWDELLPVERASYELAARIIPAVADVAEAINAQLVAKCPPAPAVAATRLVDIEDTILERVDGMDDIDPEMAAAREKADQIAAERAAEKKPKGKKRSIVDA